MKVMERIIRDEIILKCGHLFDARQHGFLIRVSLVQCATGSKILTEPEPDRIGIILVGTGPDNKPEKVNRIRPDWPDRPDWQDFTGFLKL